jgi:hypothetical protein
MNLAIGRCSLGSLWGQVALAVGIDREAAAVAPKTVKHPAIATKNFSCLPSPAPEEKSARLRHWMRDSYRRKVLLQYCVSVWPARVEIFSLCRGQED